MNTRPQLTITKGFWRTRARDEHGAEYKEG